MAIFVPNHNVEFSGKLPSGIYFSVTFRKDATVVNVHDVNEDNVITFEYEPCSLYDIRHAETLASNVLSYIKFSDNKVKRLISNALNNSIRQPNRIVHFSHVKQMAKEFYNAAN